MLVQRVCMCAAVTFLTAGCTTYDLSKGQALASAGSTLATQMRDDSANAADDYRLNAERSAMLSVLGRAKNPNLPIQVNSPDVAGYDKVANVLETRKRMFEALVSLYASLGAGMSYNASAETGAAFTSFTTALDGYQQAVDPTGTKLSSAPAIQAAGQVSQLLAGFLQKREMLKASRLVSQQLSKVRDALLAERDATLSARVTTAALKHQLGYALRDLDILDGTPDLEQAAQLAGSPVGSSAENAYQSNPRLRAALTAYDRWADDTFERQLIASEYDALIGGIDNLVKQHHRFEAGEPMNLGTLVDDAEKIEAISNTLRGKGK